MYQSKTRRHAADVAQTPKRVCYAIYQGRNWHENLLSAFQCQIVASIMGSIKLYRSGNMADTVAYMGTAEQEEIVQETLNIHMKELGRQIQALCMDYLSTNCLQVNTVTEPGDTSINHPRMEYIANIALLHKLVG